MTSEEPSSGREVLPKELFEMYYSGEERAVSIIENATETLAKGIANICCVIDPDVIIVGGSVAIYNPFYLEMAVEKSKKYLITPDKLVVKKAVFGDDAGLVGAALLVSMAGA